MKLKKAIQTKARYDPYSDKILDCKKGTKEWHHEDRHRQQHKAFPKFMEVLDLAGTYSKYLLSLSFVIGIFVPIKPIFLILGFSMLSSVVIGLMDFVIEMDAELYSWRKENGKSK